MRLTHYSLYKKTALSAIILLLTVVGIYGYFGIPVDFLPKITYPVVKVQIKWPGATPNELVSEVAEPLEKIISTVDRLDYIESSSVEGLYSLTVYFQYGSDIDIAFQDVLAAMTRANSRLPEDVDTPYVFKADPSQLPVTQLIVSSDIWDGIKLRSWVENWFENIILGVRGVAGTEIIGGKIREIKVDIDTESLEKHGLSINYIIKRLQEENIEQAGARLIIGDKEIIARTPARYSSIDDIKKILLLESDFHKVLLEDIAKVSDSSEELRMITRMNGKECVKISILKEASANTVQIADSLSLRLKDINSSLPSGIKIQSFEDQAIYVRQSINGVKNAAFSALILLVIVVYFFLGSIRQVFIMLFTLPITIILNFGLMKVAGFSLNIFSLGGLVVAIGIVLDNSIVVLENITRYRKELPDADNEEVCFKATSEVGIAIIASTISFLALFFPFLFVEGLTSLLFRELILVISGIVVISLFMAITVTPMISSVFIKKKKAGEKSNFSDNMFDKLGVFYKKILYKTNSSPVFTILFFVILTFFSLVLLRSTGGEFLPMIDDGRIMIKVRMPAGTSLSVTDNVLKKIEQKIKDEKVIYNYFSLSGGQLKGLTTFEMTNEGEINIQMIDKKKRNISTSDYVNKLRSITSKINIPDSKIMVRQAAIKGIMGNKGSDIAVNIKGQKLEVLNKLAQQAVKEMSTMDELQNVAFSVNSTRPEIKIHIDRTRAYDLGITMAEISTTVRSLVQGAKATDYRENDEYYDVVVKIPEILLNSRKDIENIIITNVKGIPIRISDIAEVVMDEGPVEINRESQIKQVSIECDITSNDLAGAVEILSLKLEKLDLPAGYEISYGGKVKMMGDMKKTVFTVMIFSIFFSFIVLTVQFNSLKLPFLIMISIPVCLSGIVYLLYFTGIPLGATVIIGLLIVISASVNDGVLLITSSEDIEKTNNLIPSIAIIDAAVLRLRPRLMTTLTTMVGFIPLAMNLEEGGDMLQPMALAAIGGLGMEALVALFLMPCLYIIINKKKR
ncbi:MAG: efflux RND transporter permease subunit [Candidatus Muirbacterium halophilum]|nr:efflux RND transporter permease subunit [Candidatus Muirbacterium halophilum]MCK9477164.1 efflux RND transporter permease subunit [Candidatus Muirbacterium halophilum]